MPDTTELSHNFRPIIALLEQFEAGTAPGWRTQALSRLRAIRAQAERVLEEKAKDFKLIYETALRGDANAEEMEEAARFIKTKERSHAEQIIPEVERLQQKLATPSQAIDPELRQEFLENIDVAIRWLALYRDTVAALLKLSNERRAKAAHVFYARPLAGDIDHAELSREFMARFPKIRAALAK